MDLYSLFATVMLIKEKNLKKFGLVKKTKFSKLSSEDNIWKENLQEKFKNTADSQAYFF